MCWSPNTPTTCRSIARRRSTSVRESSSIARRSPTGSAAPPSTCGRSANASSPTCALPTKLFADETTAPVLDPGRGRTKTGQLWAYARDDRPWGGTDPPAVAYVYAPDRTASQPIAHLSGFKGVLQVDGYAGYRALAQKGDVSLAFCWCACAPSLLRALRRRRLADRRRGAATHRAASTPSRKTSAAAAPTNAAPPARSDRVRLSPNSNPGCAPSSRSSARRASSPRRSAMRSRAGKASAASSTTAGSRSTPTRSNARSARSRSIAKMLSSPAPTKGLHTAHLAIPLYLKKIFLTIVRRRTSRPPGVGFVANGFARQLGVGDYPGRAFARLARREGSLGDQAAHG